MLRLGPLPLPLVAALALAGCSVTYCNPAAFEREAALFAGEIHGVAVLTDVEGESQPAPYAQVKVRGTNQFRRADSEGRFVVWDLAAGAWVLQISLDDDGDGLPDRRRITTGILRETEHPPELLVPQLGQETTRLTGLSVGEVVLEGTAEVGGTVLLTPSGGGAPEPPAALDRNVVVLAARNFDLPRVSEDGFDPVSLGAEARTHVDDDGAFLLRNLGAGAFYLVFLVYDRVADVGDPARLKRVSPEVYVRALPDGTTALAEPVILPAAPAPPTTGTAPLLVAPPPPSGEEMFIMLAPPGRALPDCAFPPAVDEQDFPYVWVSEVQEAASVVSFSGVPVGSWDIQACVSSGAFGEAGVLYDETVLELAPGAVAPLKGPVLVTGAADACRRPRRCDPDAAEDTCPGELTCQGAQDAARCETAEGAPLFDCDGDGRQGLPPLDDDSSAEDRDLWRVCAAPCTEGAGGAVADAVCDAGDATFDCDDDGDGQADVTEDMRCYGLGRGGDADSDGLCDPVDAFPQCRANTADECEAGNEDAPEVRDVEEPPVVLEECKLRPPPEREQGELFSTYCGLFGEETTSCEGYSMVCAFETFEGPPRELYPRLCESDADCAPPPADEPFPSVECNGQTGQCEYVADSAQVTTCDEVLCWDVFPLFLCSEGLDVRCVPQVSPPADMPCVCTSPEQGSRTLVVGGLELHTDTCSAERALGLWTSVCGFPAPDAPDATNDAGPMMDAGGDVVPEGLDCALGPMLGACTGNGEELEHCSIQETEVFTDCAMFAATCGAYPCPGGACGFLNDVCLARPGQRCNDHQWNAAAEPLITCEEGSSCSMSLVPGDPAPVDEQVCTSATTVCTGETSTQCSEVGDVLEACVSTGGDVPTAPRQWDCAKTGGICEVHPTVPVDVCHINSPGAPCDPDWGPDTLGTYPFVCDEGLGLSCVKALTTDRFGTCQAGGGAGDAGP